MEESRPDCCDVLMGASSLRRLQPREFMESRNELEAMVCSQTGKKEDGRRFATAKAPGV